MKFEPIYNINIYEGKYCRVATSRRAPNTCKIVRTAMTVADSFKSVFKLSKIDIKKSFD